MNDHTGRESVCGRDMGNNEFSWSGLKEVPLNVTNKPGNQNNDIMGQNYTNTAKHVKYL